MVVWTGIDRRGRSVILIRGGRIWECVVLPVFHMSSKASSC